MLSVVARCLVEVLKQQPHVMAHQLTEPTAVHVAAGQRELARVAGVFRDTGSGAKASIDADPRAVFGEASTTNAPAGVDFAVEGARTTITRAASLLGREATVRGLLE